MSIPRDERKFLIRRTSYSYHRHSVQLRAKPYTEIGSVTKHHTDGLWYWHEMLDDGTECADASGRALTMTDAAWELWDSWEWEQEQKQAEKEAQDGINPTAVGGNHGKDEIE